MSDYLQFKELVGNQTPFELIRNVMIIVGLATIIIYLFIIVHDQNVDVTKAHSQWYNTWKGAIQQSDDCKVLNDIISDDKDKWLKSELYPLVVQRLGELKCPIT